MSLIHDLKEIQKSLVAMEAKTKEQQAIYFNLINGMVQLAQKYRIEKNFEVSDAIRDLLAGVGVKVTQGTAQYGGYENIPENMRGRQGDDTWVMMDANDSRKLK